MKERRIKTGLFVLMALGLAALFTRTISGSATGHRSGCGGEMLEERATATRQALSQGIAACQNNCQSTYNNTHKGGMDCNQWASLKASLLACKTSCKFQNKGANCIATTKNCQAFAQQSAGAKVSHNDCTAQVPASEIEEKCKEQNGGCDIPDCPVDLEKLALAPDSHSDCVGLNANDLLSTYHANKAACGANAAALTYLGDIPLTIEDKSLKCACLAWKKGPPQATNPAHSSEASDGHSSHGSQRGGGAARAGHGGAAAAGGMSAGHGSLPSGSRTFGQAGVTASLETPAIYCATCIKPLKGVAQEDGSKIIQPLRKQVWLVLNKDQGFSSGQFSLMNKVKKLIATPSPEGIAWLQQHGMIKMWQWAQPKSDADWVNNAMKAIISHSHLEIIPPTKGSIELAHTVDGKIVINKLGLANECVYGNAAKRKQLLKDLLVHEALHIVFHDGFFISKYSNMLLEDDGATLADIEAEAIADGKWLPGWTQNDFWCQITTWQDSGHHMLIDYLVAMGLVDPFAVPASSHTQLGQNDFCAAAAAEKTP